MSDTLTIILFIGLWILNFIISGFNAVSVGRAFRDPECYTGWMRVVLWSVIVMAVCGFTWCYLIIVALAAGYFGIISDVYVQGALQLGYLLIILPIIGSGLVIWVQSMINAYKQRTFGSYAVAGWNTFANISNIFSAFKSVPKMLGNVGGLFEGGGDSKDKGILIMVLVVIVAIIAGGLTTYGLIQWGKKNG